MNRFLILLKTSRPAFWVVAPLIFVIGFIFSGARLEGFPVLPLIQILMLSFPYCIFLYGINDVYDYESDRINPRKKDVEGVKLEPKYHSLIKNASWIIVLLLILSSLLTFNITNITGMALLLFFSYYYSAPPLRLKEIPPFDSISNGILYFLAPFFIGYGFGGNILEIPLKIYLISIGALAMHTVSTIVDYSYDKKVGDKTFAVVFGKRAAAIFGAICFAVVLFFANIQTAIVNYYLMLCIILSLVAAIYPSEKLMGMFSKIYFLGFVAAGIWYLIIA